MGLDTQLSQLGARAALLAGELDVVMSRAEDDPDEAFDSKVVWRSIAALQEAAGVLSTLANTGATPGPFDDVGLRAAIRADSEHELVRQLAEALGHDLDDDVPFPPTFWDLLDDVRGLRISSAGRAEDLQKAREFVQQIANASGASGVHYPVLDYDQSALVDRVRVQREERGQMLQALRDHLGQGETSTYVDDLVGMLKSNAVGTIQLDNLRRNLQVALGDLQMETSDEQLVFHARTVNDQLKALYKKQVDVLDGQVKAQRRTRDALLRVAKSLQTYAPGMDDMPDDELATTVCGIAETVVAEHRRAVADVAYRRSMMGNIAEAVGLGRGADAPTILSTLKSLGDVEWSRWADELADALGVPNEDDDVPWTDEAMELLVDRARELAQPHVLRDLDTYRDVFLRIASALGVAVPMPSEPWDQAAVDWLVERASEVAGRRTPRAGYADVLRALGWDAQHRTWDECVAEIEFLRQGFARLQAADGKYPRQLARALGVAPDVHDWHALVDMVRAIASTVVGATVPGPTGSGANHGEPG